jgi:hypothetical protein
MTERLGDKIFTGFTKLSEKAHETQYDEKQEEHRTEGL